MTPELLLYLTLICHHHKVEVPFARAVMKIESRERLGPLGRKGTYIGPFGIHKDFRRKWNIDDPYVNIAVGVAALRGGDKVTVLKRYNKTWWRDNYIKDVMACYRQYRDAPVQSGHRKQP